MPSPDRLGAAAGRRRDRLCALDGLEGAAAGGDLAAAEAAEGAGQQLRVALPRRPAAHGHQPLRALPAARPPRHRRPLAAVAPLDASRDPASATTSHTRSSTTTPGSPSSSSTTTRKRHTVTGFVERALAFFAEHGIIAKRLMTDNGFSYVKNRSLAELLASTASATSPPSPTGPAPTARSSASTRRWRANGPTASPTAHLDTATPRCHTGSTTTTGDDRTAHSETGHRSAAFTTSVGRTARGVPLSWPNALSSHSSCAVCASGAS